MPKDKLLRDVRYFEAHGEHITSLPSYAGSIYDMPKAAISIGQRVGCKCEEAGISIGPASHLYIALVPTLPFGQVVQSTYQAETWHRFVACGVPEKFNELPVADKLRSVERITFIAIRSCSDQTEKIEAVENQVRLQGENLAIIRRRKETKRYIIEVLFTVAPFGKPSAMWLRVVERASSLTAETERWPLRFYDDVFDLVDRVSLKSDDKVVILPRASYRAGLTTRQYEVPMTVDLAALMSAQQRTAGDVGDARA